MSFPLVSLVFLGVEYDRPSLNPLLILEKIFLLLVRELFRVHENLCR